MYCSKCGSEISKENKYCPKCGNEVNAIKSKVNNTKSILILLLILLLAGGVIVYFIIKDNPSSNEISKIEEKTDESYPEENDMLEYKNKRDAWTEKFALYYMEDETKNSYDECMNNLSMAIENNDKNACIEYNEKLDNILKIVEDETSSLLAWYQGSIFLQDLSYLPDESKKKMSEYEIKAKEYLDVNNYAEAFEYYGKCIDIIQNSSTEVDTNIASATEWKQLFLNFISIIEKDNENGDFSGQGYSLVYIDNDNIPEIIARGTDRANGDRMCIYNNGRTSETSLGMSSISYIEHENLIWEGYGNMDYYYDLIYQIQNGTLVDIVSGEYGAEDNTNIQYDESGNPIYEYLWNGEIQTEIGYQDCLNKVFDINRAININDIPIYSKNEMIKKIEGL